MTAPLVKSDAPSFLELRRRQMHRTLVGRVTARVRRVAGLVVETTGMPIPVGSVCRIRPRIGDTWVHAEVVGFQESVSLLMPLGEMQGVGPGDLVECVSIEQFVPVGPHLLGRVLDGRGRAMDGKGAILSTETRPVYADPPDPVMRPRITEPMPTGVRAIDAFMTVGRGQRIGIMAGTGVGKSTLMGSIARFSTADVAVIALVGERGREVRDFIEKDLGEEGLARSVVVVATSDQPAPVRVMAPFVATSIAEYFRDQGMNVALLMDSVTRMAMAQRDIGSSVGEVPAQKGYTPSVFAKIPKLMERAGRSPHGSITAFYTVLVEGDDMNEPISDATRGVLDGHLVLSRRLAQRGQYPAVDVLQSISRVMPQVCSAEHVDAANALREMMAVYNEAEDMVNINAYVPGSNPQIDRAIATNQPLRTFLKQGIGEGADFESTRTTVFALAGMSSAPAVVDMASNQSAPPPTGQGARTATGQPRKVPQRNAPPAGR